MAIVTNFDRLKEMHQAAIVGGSNSRAWLDFAVTMMDSFSKLYETAKEMNAQQDKKSNGVALWRSLSDSFPDSDMTVLLFNAEADEPVWLGYHDGLAWRYVDGGAAEPTHWADLPEPPNN